MLNFLRNNIQQQTPEETLQQCIIGFRIAALQLQQTKTYWRRLRQIHHQIQNENEHFQRIAAEIKLKSATSFKTCDLLFWFESSTKLEESFLDDSIIEQNLKIVDKIMEFGKNLLKLLPEHLKLFDEIRRKLSSLPRNVRLMVESHLNAVKCVFVSFSVYAKAAQLCAYASNAIKYDTEMIRAAANCAALRKISEQIFLKVQSEYLLCIYLLRLVASEESVAHTPKALLKCFETSMRKFTAMNTSFSEIKQLNYSADIYFERIKDIRSKNEPAFEVLFANNGTRKKFSATLNNLIDQVMRNSAEDSKKHFKSYREKLQMNVFLNCEKALEDVLGCSIAMLAASNRISQFLRQLEDLQMQARKRLFAPKSFDGFGASMTADSMRGDDQNIRLFDEACAKTAHFTHYDQRLPKTNWIAVIEEKQRKVTTCASIDEQAQSAYSSSSFVSIRQWMRTYSAHPLILVLFIFSIGIMIFSIVEALKESYRV